MKTRQHRGSLLTSQMASRHRKLESARPRARLLICAIVGSALLATAALAQQVNTSDGTTRTTADSAFQLYWDNAADVWKFRCAGSAGAGSAITWTDGPSLDTSCAMSGVSASAVAASPDRGIQFNSGGAFAADSTFVYTSAGRLGIGTATPSYPLEVTSSQLIKGSYSPVLNIETTSGSDRKASIGFRGAGGSGLWSIQSDKAEAGTQSFSISDDIAGATRLHINSSGNVGIGTTSPTAGLHNSIAGAASLPGMRLDGTWFTGGTATTTKPYLLIEPSGTTSTSWNTAGTALGINAPSGFTGNLLDIKINDDIFQRVSINYYGSLNLMGMTVTGGYGRFQPRGDTQIGTDQAGFVFENSCCGPGGLNDTGAGTGTFFNIKGGIANGTASASNLQLFAITGAVNRHASSTGWYRGLTVVPTETAVGGSTSNYVAFMGKVVGGTEYKGYGLKSLAGTGFQHELEGNVGIGDTAPTNKLMVKDLSTGGPQAIFYGGNSIYNNVANSGEIQLGNEAASSSGWMQFQYASADFRIGARGAQISFHPNTAASSVSSSTAKMTITSGGNVGIGETNPQSPLHVPDGKYVQFEDNNSGAPPAADCDNDAERGRISLDTSNNRIYVCMGATRGWDYAALTD